MSDLQTDKNIVIDQAVVKDDGSMMFTVWCRDNPDFLYAYDKVQLKEECDGGFYLEFTLSISSRKDSHEIKSEVLDKKGESIIQYLFETTTGVKL